MRAAEKSFTSAWSFISVILYFFNSEQKFILSKKPNFGKTGKNHYSASVSVTVHIFCNINDSYTYSQIKIAY